MTVDREIVGWKPGDVRRAAEASIFRAFVIRRRDELHREQIIDALDIMGTGKDTGEQSRQISRIDVALRALVAAGRLVRVRKGIFSIIGRDEAAR